MENKASRFGAVVILLLLAGIAPVSAQTAPLPSVTFAASGSFARGGSFEGTVTINRFEQRLNEIVAVGFVSGTLSRGGRSIGTAFAGEVTWPVKITVGPLAAAPRDTPPTAQVVPAAWAPPPAVTLVQNGCPVLDVSLGPLDVDLLGVQVGLDPIALQLAGAAGTPLGELVCAVSALIGNVAGLVNLLNAILGLLTGLLGGLTGGLGGIPV